MSVKSNKDSTNLVKPLKLKKVYLEWVDGELVSVKIHDKPKSPDKKNWRVFKVVQRKKTIELIADPSAIVANVVISRGVRTVKLEDRLGDTQASGVSGAGFYRAKLRSGGGTILEPLDIPNYYIDRVKKKLDIRDNWTSPFNSIAETVINEGRTLLGYDRLYTLWQVVRNIAHLESPIIEVGVLRGGSTRLIVEAQRHFGKKGTIYACDTFSGHPSVDPNKDLEQAVGDFADKADAREVRAFLSSYPEVQLVVQDIMHATEIPSVPIAALHLDVDVYPAMKFCLERFASQLVTGGLIVVDDYGFVTCPGAKLAVDEFIGSRKDMKMLYLLTGQVVIYRN